MEKRQFCGLKVLSVEFALTVTRPSSARTKCPNLAPGGTIIVPSSMFLLGATYSCYIDGRVRQRLSPEIWEGLMLLQLPTPYDKLGHVLASHYKYFIYIHIYICAHIYIYIYTRYIAIT